MRLSRSLSRSRARMWRLHAAVFDRPCGGPQFVPLSLPDSTTRNDVQKVPEPSDTTICDRAATATSCAHFLRIPCV